jgi:hypothetical protein
LFVLPDGDNGLVYGDAQVEKIASGLFSVFKSIGTIPLVRVQNGDISERVFRKLANLYAQYKDHQVYDKKKDRPLLILLDRNLDLHTPLYHSWTYLPLLHDIFSINSNN